MSNQERLPVMQDWRMLRLDTAGRSLIEASAGTGKTWTIAVLYLRLILELQLTPRTIVVTSFTNAAADELRQRLRARLLWAEARASARIVISPDTAHMDEAWLLARWNANPVCQTHDLQRLRVAIAEFDRAPITTLHGLCQKILSDQPFAAGAAFKDELLVNSENLLSDIAKDLLRHLYQADAESDALTHLYETSNLELKQSDLLKKLSLIMRPGVVVNCLSGDEIRARLPQHWSAELNDLCRYFKSGSKLIRAWQALAQFIDDPSAPVEAAQDLEQELRISSQLKGWLKPYAEERRLHAAAAFAQQCADNGVLRCHEQKFWSVVADWAHTQMNARLRSLNQRSFDDLLSSVYEALNKEIERGLERPLADALFAAWPFALVDEFQDTDAIQYGILDCIYRHSNHSERGRLLMIGDPKQAIYRFRGGDIHTYLKAAQAVPEKDQMTLHINRRSSRSFIAALNEFYAHAGTAMGMNGGDGIHYAAVDASDRQDHAPYTINAQACTQPLVFHCAVSKSDERPTRQLALRICANQIADMLHSGAHSIQAKPLAASDIAVLLPTNSSLNTLRDLLRERGIASVTTSRDSVFSTDVAHELLLILYAIAHHVEPEPMRAALATRLIGLDYADLRRMADDSRLWQGHVRDFHAWQDIWQKRGVQSVIHTLIERYASGQLNLAQGERHLTDLRHLGELLQAQSERMTGRAELLTWFAEQRDAHTADEEATQARQLRIESDAPRVRLMTLHASKGLEFPIVFLPLMWDHGEKRSLGLYQSTADSGVRCIEMSEEAKRDENRALQDERFRILYVALTRAIHACHVFTVPIDSALNETRSRALDVMLARMQPAMGSSALKAATPHIRWCDTWAPDTWQTIPVHDAISTAPRCARTPLPHAATPLPAKHSFTTLTHGLHGTELATEAAADDEQDSEETTESLRPLDWHSVSEFTALEAPLSDANHPELLALEVVKGVDFGNAVHAIFEHRNALQALTDQRPLVQRYLAEYQVCAVGAEIEHRLIKRLQCVLETPLGAAQGDGPKLAELQAADMRAEMAFYFAMDNTSLDALRNLCNAFGEPNLVPNNHRNLAGLMNGKIDLVFRYDGRYHVLDYKGNYLGTRVTDYCGAALCARMDSAHYRFQALLYSVALDRYLSQRLVHYQRSRHLGDCYYIFIRAVGLAADAGIWRHRFSDALIDAVQDAFAQAAVVRSLT